MQIARTPSFVSSRPIIRSLLAMAGAALLVVALTVLPSAALPPSVDLNSTNAGLTVYGDAAGDNSGYAVASGDVNGDTTADLIIGAYRADPGGRTDAGETYVIYGGVGLPKTIDLSSASADVTVLGESLYDRSGYAVATGDIDGDTTDDLIIGAWGADSGAGSDVGATYVIYGGGSLPATIDLSSTSPDLVVIGDDANDGAGYALAAGDVSGDSTDDVIIGTRRAGPPGAQVAGETYVIYGGGSLPATINLDATPADVTVYGDDPFDNSGQAIAAGDIDGDTTDDLIIGAWVADGSGIGSGCGSGQVGDRCAAGETYVIYGGSLPATIELDTTAADLTVYGDDTSDYSGRSVAAADVDGDTTDDLIIGAYGGDPPGRPAGGEVYVVHGGGALPATIDLDSDSPDVTVLGAFFSDSAGWAVAAGDISRDGVDDLIVGAIGADASGGAQVGGAYIVFGGSLPSSVDLNSEADLSVFGDDPNDNSGSVLAAGDINGDGSDDLIMGAYTADPSGRTNAGETYVIYGAPPPTPTPTDTATATPAPKPQTCDTAASPAMCLHAKNGAGDSGLIDCDDLDDPTKCTVAVDQQFELTVQTSGIPLAGYSGAETAIYFTGLVWKQRPDCAAEVIWPAVVICGEAKGLVGQAFHVGVSGTSQPFPLSTFEGGLVQIDVSCSAPGTYDVTLAAYPSTSPGARYIEENGNPVLVEVQGQAQIDTDGDTTAETVDVADSLTLNCVSGATPTPTPTPSDTPTPAATPTPTPTSTPTPLPGSVSADADGDDTSPSDPVDGTRNVEVGTKFFVSVHVDDPPAVGAGGYSAYRVELRWDEPLLDYQPTGDPASENVWPEPCTPARSIPPDDDGGKEAAVILSCIAASLSSHTGPVAQFQFVCEQEGSSQLSLVSLPFDPVDGTMLIDANGDPSSPTITNAKINCIGPDSDTDGLPNYWEDTYACTDSSVIDDADDDDSDGQSHLVEFGAGTDPCDADTDDDGLTDGDELKTHFTDATSADTDGDGLSDGDEINTHLTDPFQADSDQDGLNDGFELTIGTDANDPDSDDDGFPDGEELLLGSDPSLNTSTPEHVSLPATCSDGQDNDGDLDVDTDDGDCSDIPPPNVAADTDLGTAADGRPLAIRGETVTISYLADPPATNVTIEVTGPNPPTIGPTKMIDLFGNGKIWQATFVPPVEWPAGSTPLVKIVADAMALDAFGIVLIDPSGDIFDSDTLDLIEGATVQLFRYNAATDDFELMDPVLHAGMFDPEVNPQTTGPDGRYAWDVAAGDYFVRVSKPGCSTEDSSVVTIPPEVTDLDVGLTCPDTDGDGLKDHIEIEVGTNYLDADHDGDTCPDGRELGPNAVAGGQRDPTDPWDYFETTGDRKVRVPDIVAVVVHFGQDQGVEGSTYSTTYDRGGQVGPNPWDQAPPNGTIRVPDIVAVVQQFGHDCA